MIKIKTIISLVIILTSLLQLSAQNFADKEFYLIDSLILNELTESDSLLIKESLTSFHKTNHDSLRIAALNNIINNCWTPTTWVSYNEYANYFATEKLEANNFSSENDKINMTFLLALTEYYKGYTND